MNDQEINIYGEEENDTSTEENEVDSEEDEKTISFISSKTLNEQHEENVKKQWADYRLSHQKIDLEVPFLPPKL